MPWLGRFLDNLFIADMSISSRINKLIPRVRYVVKKQKPNKILQLSDDPVLYSPESNGPTQMGDIPIYIFDDVLFWPGQSIASREGYLIKQTYIDEDRINTVRKRQVLRRYPVMKFDGWATSIDYIFSPHNYYHQYIDSLPRTWALRHPELKSLPITLFTTRQLDHDQKLMLQAILPESVQIRAVPRFVRIRAKHYIHLPFLSKNRTGYNPEDTLTSAGFIPDEYIESYRKRFFEINKTQRYNGYKHIYVSRRKAMKRRVLNEEEVINYLKEKDFLVVELEDLRPHNEGQSFVHVQHSGVVLLLRRIFLSIRHTACITNL